ncbi:hypothetical protein ACQU0X_26135 [Pseudovibrio ascidiaceicola]|uniref:hypothetical protein n=1 Tax=Pseudovibrio ascidiaceicola TaxID=285279 RepID=UPI003D35F80D
MRKILTAALILFTLAPAALAVETTEPNANELRAIVKEVSKNLKDPYSAQFHDVMGMRMGEGIMQFCGFVNAKNSHGAYAGKIPFVVSLYDGAPGPRTMVPGQPFYSEKLVYMSCSMAGIFDN